MTFRPSRCSVEVDQAITQTAKKFNLPRWFLYALVERESSFNPTDVNTSNNGLGLTQLTGEWHQGMPYPENLPVCDNNSQAWIWDMGLDNDYFGVWINMCQVSRLSDPFDPVQNLERFCTVHAVPFYLLMEAKFPHDGYTRLLEKVALAWNQGIFATFDPLAHYLIQYREYVGRYRPPVEVDDGVWDGKPHLEAAPGHTHNLALRGVGDPTVEAYTVVAEPILSMDEAMTVTFWVDGVMAKTENYPPYALFGDDGGELRLGKLGPGAHQVLAILFHQFDDEPLAHASTTLFEGVPPPPPPPPSVDPYRKALVDLKIGLMDLMHAIDEVLDAP